MKIQNKLYLLAVTAAALSLSTTTGVGQVFSSADVLNNQAIATSPRAKEAFPWLLHVGTGAARSQVASVPSKSQLAAIKANSALAASPRVKELYPELAFSAVSAGETTTVTRAGINPVTEVRRNSALAASPRMKELYPELNRSAEESISIAPLK